MDLNIKNMGAVPDGKTKNTEIIQRAIDLCAISGGSVVISDGVYLTGKIIMRSNVELHIMAGGVCSQHVGILKGVSAPKVSSERLPGVSR